MAPGAHLREIDGLIGAHRRPLAEASVFGVAGVVLQLAKPWPLTIAIDHAIEHRPFRGALSFFASWSPDALIMIAALSSLLIAALAAACDYFVVTRTEFAAERIGADLRRRLFGQGLTLSLRYHDRTGSGELISRLTTDVGRILDAIVATATTLLPDGVLLVGIVVVLMRIDTRLASLALVTVPVLAFLAIRQRERVRSAQRVAREESGRMVTAAADMVRNVRAVQSFGQHARVERWFDRYNHNVLHRQLDAVAVEARWAPRSDLVLAVGAAAVLLVGAHRAAAGTLSTGTLLVVISYLSSLYSPVRSLARLSGTFAKSGASTERLNDVLACTERVPDRAGAIEAPPVRERVRFDHVAFAYDPGIFVLEDQSFTVGAGTTMCLLGPSGIGKSTILHLLLRLYDVDRGAITIDGVDVRDCSLTSLRERIAYVPQDPWLLDGTIFENIVFGGNDATTWYDVVEAARTARVDEFALALAEGYDARVGEGGARLSGGQRRRVAIARAIVARAPLVLLDEPTSSLDAVAATAVIDAIRNLASGRTVVIVTHDPRLAAIADETITLTGPPVASHAFDTIDTIDANEEVNEHDDQDTSEGCGFAPAPRTPRRPQQVAQP